MTGPCLPEKRRRTRTSGGRDRSSWRERCAREPERGQATARNGKAIRQTGQRGWASRQSAAICKAVDTIVAQNNVIEHGDAEQVASLVETGGERTILRTGFRISRGVMVGADARGGVQEDSRFEDFAGMDDAECQGADDGVFGVETANEELLAVVPAKELQCCSLVGLPCQQIVEACREGIKEPVFRRIVQSV